MRKSALRRAVGAWAVLSTAALLFGSGVVGSTFATFSAETMNANSGFADGWLGAPTAAATPFNIAGYDVKVNWTATTTGPISSYQVWGVDNGTTSSCTGASYANLSATGLTATSNTWTHSNIASTHNGDYYCYEVISTSTTATNWTSTYVMPATQIGLVLQSVAINGNRGGSIAANDQVLLTFNQPPATLGTNPTVCVFKSPNVILLGDTHSGGCSANSDTTSIGKLTSSATISWSGGTTSKSFTTTQAVSGNVLTLTLGGANSATVSTGASYSWTQPTTGTVKSSATTDQATVCSAVSATCSPSTPTVTRAF